MVLFEEQEHIGIITLNRPNAANALSKKLLDELMHVCSLIASKATIRVVVLRSAGDKIFCAGADLKERAEMQEEEVFDAVKKISKTIETIAALPQPVIVEANGSAFGGGLELCLACDVRVFSEEAYYGLTETSLAIIPGAGGTQRLPRLIGEGRAKEMIYTSKRITGTIALSYGMCEYAVSAKDTSRITMDLAKQMASNGPLALRAAKHAMVTGRSLPLAEALDKEKEAYSSLLNTKDRLEGLLAFKEKRKASYQGH